MSELTKQQLTVENNSSFPNNNTGFITPTLLRTFNGNIIDSMVDEVTYNANSASWETEITALQQFSSSLDANFVSTAELNASSSTLQNNINTKLNTSSFNAYTASQEVISASFNTRINSVTGSATNTGSLLLTASAVSNVITFTKGDGSTFPVTVGSVIDSSSLVTTSSFNAYTQSAASGVSASINAATQSLSSSIATTTSNLSSSLSASIGALSASVAVTDLAQSSSIAQLLGFSSSLDTTFATDAQLSASASTLQDDINTRLLTSSFQTYTSSVATQIAFLGTNKVNYNAPVNPQGMTGSLIISGASTNGGGKTLTLLGGPNPATDLALHILSGSVEITTPQGNGAHFYSNAPITSSNLRINGTAVIKDLFVSGTWGGTGSGSLFVENSITASVISASTIIANSASFQYVQTVFETASIIYSSGSNQFGDELSDVQTLSGSVKVQGGLTVNGTDVLLVGQTASYASASISSSFAITATTASFALNGGVTQLLAGQNITISPLSGKGQVTISSTGTGSGNFNTATGSYGSFYDTTTQPNPVANAANSMSFNETAITNGVSISGSTNPFNTYIKTENAGVYNLQFSAQLDKTDSGTDSVDIWIRKNGIDLLDTGTTVTLTGNNDKSVAAWNWFVQSAANDYYQIIWSSADTDMRLLAEVSSSVHPGIPSVIATANRVDQFLSNTGSFSGTFNGYNLTEFTTTSSFNSYTASQTTISSSFNSRITALETGSAPLGTVSSSAQIVELGFLQTSSFNTYTSSNDIRVNDLIAKTGSFITTGSATITQNITGSLIISGNTFNAKVSESVLSVGTTTLDTLFESTASGVTSQIDLTRLGAGPTGDLTGVRLQTLSGSDTAGDTLLSRITTGVNRHTTTQMTGSVVNTSILSTWATGSAGDRVSYTSQVNANAQSASATLTLAAGNLASNYAGGTASLQAGRVNIGTTSATITSTGSFTHLGSLVTSQGITVNSGGITATSGSINGDLRVTQNLTASIISASTTIQTQKFEITASSTNLNTAANIRVPDYNATGSYVNNIGQNLDTSVAGLLHVVNISSASMATLLSGATTNPNTIYFVI